MPTLQTHKGYPLWHYIPNIGAAIFFIIIYVVVTVFHQRKIIQTKAWFCVPFLVGCYFEILGYIGRALAYNDTGSLIPYMIQSLFLLLPPILFAASLYMTYARIVVGVHGEDMSIIAPHKTSRIFVIGDIACLCIQGGGAGLMIVSSAAKYGLWIVVVGLVFQILLFGFFMVVCIAFHRRLLAFSCQTTIATAIPWQSYLTMLYATSVMILVRNIYRTVEFSTGTTGYLMSTEWPTYVFDGILMFAVTVLFYFWYPGQLPGMPKPGTRESTIELSSSDGNTQKHSREGTAY